LYDDWKKRCGEEAADMPEFQASKQARVCSTGSRAGILYRTLN